MFSFIIKRSTFYIFAVSRRILPSSYSSELHCYKSTAAETKIPDNVQILKSVSSSSCATLKVKTISKAMKAYLERSKKHDDFLKVKNDEFEIGRLHLANMMGLDATTLTQDDIDKAIVYLFPSGLYEPKARPMMKPPIQLFPKEKAAQFDNSGRPFNPFFYTKTSNYFKELHHLAGKFYELDDFQDKMIEKGILTPPSESALSLTGGEWMTPDELKQLFLENINEQQYELLITTLTRLGNHPYSFRCKDDIWKFRKKFADLGAVEEIPQLLTDENGRPFIEMKGSKKHCEAKVVVRGNGTGEISINGSDIFHFPRLQDREQIMYPLHFCDMLGLVDVEAEVWGPGEASQAGAIRYALSLCLRSFVKPEFIERMRLAGLLTLDGRKRGRKKPGQKGNVAKYTWKKR